MALELVPLCTLHMQLKPPIVVGAACAGRRVIVEVASIEVKGDRLRGEMMGAAAADWLLIGPEGTVTPDIRAALRTDDGAIIFMQYNGRMTGDWSQGPQLPATVYVAPRFETCDERYLWLNRIQASARGPFTRTGFRSTTSGTKFARAAGLLIRRLLRGSWGPGQMPPDLAL